MTTSDDDQPTAVACDDDATATAIGTEDVGTAPAPSETETEAVYAWSLDVGGELAAQRKWRGRVLWAGLVALLCATVAAVVWFSMMFYVDDLSAIPSSPPAAQIPAPRPALAPPAPAPAPPAAAPTPPAAPTPAPPTAPAAPVAAPAPRAAPPPQPAPVQAPPPEDANQRFAGSLAQGGMWQNEADDDQQARALCQDLANGESPDEYIAGTIRKSPQLTPQEAAQVVHDAIEAYCPQFG